MLILSLLFILLVQPITIAASQPAVPTPTALNGTLWFIKNTITVTEPITTLSLKIKRNMAEVALYNASRLLELGMVPQTIIHTLATAQGTTIRCASQWIHKSPIRLNNSDHLKSLISPAHWSAMNIFHFLFGQYDRHLGNIIVQEGSHHVYLIDNEAAANMQQYVAGYSPDKRISNPWVALENFTGQRPDLFIDTAATFEEVILQSQDPTAMKLAFPDVDEWTVHDIEHGYCRVWRNKLWRQFYASEDLAAPFAQTINASLFKKIQQLDNTALAALWPSLPCAATPAVKQAYTELINQFVERTLVRKKMIIDYFNAHQASIIDDCQ